MKRPTLYVMIPIVKIEIEFPPIVEIHITMNFVEITINEIDGHTRKKTFENIEYNIIICHFISILLN